MRVVTSTMRMEVRIERGEGERALIEHGGRNTGRRERPGDNVLTDVND